jgi:hypothetical protein
MDLSKTIRSGQKQLPVLGIAFLHDYDSFIKGKHTGHQVHHHWLWKRGKPLISQLAMELEYPTIATGRLT